MEGMITLRTHKVIEYCSFVLLENKTVWFAEEMKQEIGSESKVVKNKSKGKGEGGEQLFLPFTKRRR